MNECIAIKIDNLKRHISNSSENEIIFDSMIDTSQGSLLIN